MMLRPPFQVELETDLQRVREQFRCDHHDAHLEIRRKQAANGPMYRFQCMRCGRGVGTWIKHVDLPKRPLPDWDETLSGTHWKKLADAIQDVRHRYLDPSMAFDYSHYLQSPQWKLRRQAVLRRSQGVCEACGLRAPVEVHHLTYRNVGQEYLWELAAVCTTCHDRLHPDKRGIT